MQVIFDLAYLNTACNLSLNVTDIKYNMFVKRAQLQLKEILGPEFYEEIEGQYPSSFTADNTTLYNSYIKDYLAWQTYFYYLKMSDAEATPTGVREFNDENSSVLSDVKKYSFEKNILDFVTVYKNQLINFLKLAQSKDSTKYPMWEDSCKEQFSFAISAIDKSSDSLIKVNKSIITNE